MPTPDRIEVFRPEGDSSYPDVSREIESGLDTKVYGPYFGQMVDYAATRILEGTIDRQAAALALSVAGDRYQEADNRYSTQDRILTDNELAAHQANVLAGNIALIPEEAQVSIENSIAQVEGADNAFYDQPSSVQAALADLNYGAFFRPQTMASAARTLGLKEIDRMLETGGHEAMPHLTVSNWAIAQTLAGIYERAAGLGASGVRIFDIGSGQGATLASVTEALASLDLDEDSRPPIAITGIEATRGFYGDLTRAAEENFPTQALGLEIVKHDPKSSRPISVTESLTLVNGDAVGALKWAEITDEKDALAVAIANYSFHRLGRKEKMEMLEALGYLPNVIFLVGDLANNTSPVNRRYFNLGVNGPLNAGNLYLPETFQGFGYDVANLDQSRPATLDPRIAERLRRDDKERDGHLWIATRGALATQSLELVEV